MQNFLCLSVLICCTLFIPSENICAQAFPEKISLKQESDWIDSNLMQRLDEIVPSLMRREHIDLWIISAREYNEDPVIRTMLPSTWFAARRRTILLFFDNGSSVERFAVARYDIGDFFRKIWNPDTQPDQIQCLIDFIREKNPQKIAFNYSETYAQADGISYSEMNQILEKLTDEEKKKVVSAENLAVGWLETRTSKEVELLKTLTNYGHEIIKKGFSSEVISVGKTTTSDVQWWFREEIRSIGFQTWFHPSVSVQRQTHEENNGDFSSKPESEIIKEGDLLHVDIGISFGRLHTDQQQHAYVLKRDEKDAPDGLKRALKKGNQLQDLLTSEFELGKTGNEMLKNARKKAISESLKPTIYSHPIGFYGHGAGPTIGMWDNQNEIKGTGDYKLFANTGYSIELNVAEYIPEWEKEIRIMLEEDAFFDGIRISYYDGRQIELILIK